MHSLPPCIPYHHHHYHEHHDQVIPRHVSISHLQHTEVTMSPWRLASWEHGHHEGYHFPTRPLDNTTRRFYFQDVLTGPDKVLTGPNKVLTGPKMLTGPNQVLTGPKVPGTVPDDPMSVMRTHGNSMSVMCTQDGASGNDDHHEVRVNEIYVMYDVCANSVHVMYVQRVYMVGIHIINL